MKFLRKVSYFNTYKSRPHREYAYAVIVQCPRARDPRQRISVSKLVEKFPNGETKGYPRAYDGILPARYIRGFLNLTSGEFVSNPLYL